jgi:hypothetical protein
MVDTGSNLTVFDKEGLTKWGVERLGEIVAYGWGGNTATEKYRLRGFNLGEYDTRRSYIMAYGAGIDLTGLNKSLTGQKRSPIQGMLGNFDLLNGSAVLDFGTNTLYLRPARESIFPKLEGKWNAVGYEFDGRKGRYGPGDGEIEFKGGLFRLTTRDGVKEWRFHVRDEGDRYRIGLFDPKANESADSFRYFAYGAFRFVGGKLTLVMEQGRSLKDSIEFAAPKDSNLLLVEYERAK